MLSMFAGFGFEWPPAIKAIFNALSVLNFNLDIVAPECSVTLTFETKWCVALQAWCASLYGWQNMVRCSPGVQGTCLSFSLSSPRLSSSHPCSPPDLRLCPLLAVLPNDQVPALLPSPSPSPSPHLQVHYSKPAPVVRRGCVAAAPGCEGLAVGAGPCVPRGALLVNGQRHHRQRVHQHPAWWHVHAVLWCVGPRCSLPSPPTPAVVVFHAQKQTRGATPSSDTCVSPPPLRTPPHFLHMAVVA